MIVILMTWVASNIIQGRIGRAWMMIRDMDIAAELMGVKPLAAKLSAFAVSSFYCGVAGALMVFFWLGAAEVESFDINHSFLFLFMVIIGGMGSLIGSFMGAAFIWVLPIIIKFLPGVVGIEVAAADYRWLVSSRTAPPMANSLRASRRVGQLPIQSRQLLGPHRFDVGLGRRLAGK